MNYAALKKIVNTGYDINQFEESILPSLSSFKFLDEILPLTNTNTLYSMHHNNI